MPNYLLIPNIQIPNVHFRGCSSLCHYIIGCLTCSIWKGNLLSQTASFLLIGPIEKKEIRSLVFFLFYSKVVRLFASASTVYVTVNGTPPSVWNAT
jgi:hypothetical protein